MKAKQKNKKSGASEEKVSEARRWHADLRPETKKSIMAIALFLGTALLVLSFLGKGGLAGGYLFRMFDWLLGRGYFFAPVIMLIVAFSLLFSRARKVFGPSIVGGLLLLITNLGGLEVVAGNRTGGLFGALVGGTLLKMFDVWASVLILAGFVVIALLLVFNIPLWRMGEREEEDGIEESQGVEPSVPESAPQIPDSQADDPAGLKKILENMGTTLQAALAKKTELPPPTSSSIVQTPSAASNSSEDSSLAVRKVMRDIEYKKPPMELLQGDRGKPSSGDVRANMNIIKRTLENFGIDVEMGEVSVGPTVTQYTLRPAEGVKLSRIVALHSDLSLALAAHPIRIEAPIPGKSLVGIEVPNRAVSLVGLRALLEHQLWQTSNQPLLFVVGRDVTGSPVFADLAKMPHLLISGATGSGKSVCIHSLITSFLYRNPPQLLRFILVDPKRVELSVYNDIPHLFTPVITDAKVTIQALRWATKEMDRRYDLLSQRKSRDIVGYNVAVVKDQDADPLPYIVIMIDELADLMAVFPREVESSIIRLAQMARAVGIHLVVATQRPSVEVLTGLIKANITSRIAFQVASQVDSRTILDTAGAEKLLGNGDMLFLAGDTGKPRRIQGAYMSEQEVKRVVDFLREESVAPEYEEAILQTKLEDEGTDEVFEEGDDPLYEEAQQLVVDAGRASASYLQRRLRIGYARAARLLDLMETNGVIGPADGAKPREILVRTANVSGNEYTSE